MDKDLYKRTVDNNGVENFNLSSTKKGDAVWETSSVEVSKEDMEETEKTLSWFSDYSYMPHTHYPFFIRGGNATFGSKAGLFSFMAAAGGTSPMNGFRVSIAKSL